MVTATHLLMGFPFIGFVKFGILPKMDYDRYRMHYVYKYVIDGNVFYLHEN